MIGELTLHYRGTSAIVDDEVRLATSLSAVFFDGFATHPMPAARALACVAQVATTRFFEPAQMIAARIRAADPVVTAAPGRLRFESFSQCAGVHARFDLVEDGLDVRAFAPGTTNVDFNPPVRAALAKITRRDPLRLTVGADEVMVRTLDDTVVERRVPLPERWVKGFGEVQVAVASAVPMLSLGRVAARRFLDSLPAGKTVTWALPAGSGVRLTGTPTAEAVCLAGTSRLRALAPLARFGDGLRAFGTPGTAAAVAWVLRLPGGRITLTLSPEPSRGFSGEGGLLLDLVSPSAEAAAAAVDSLSDAGGPALTWLGAHGHVGYDAVDGEYFWRHLPYPDEALRAEPPRLRDARELTAEPLPEGGYAVFSGGSEYRASLDDGGGFRCTCPWVAKHGTSRGPCKHVLAVAISRG